MNDESPRARGASVETWLSLLYRNARGNIRIDYVKAGQFQGQTFSLDELAKIGPFIERLDQEGATSIYHRATTLRDGVEGVKRGGAADSVDLVGFWADIDIAGPGHKHKPEQHGGRPLPPDETTARAIVSAAGLLEPTAWIHSGGGLYAWWLLNEPVPADGLGPLSQRLQNALGRGAEALGFHYGTGVGDLARVLRVPGSVNRKTDTPAVCRILSSDGPRYTVGDIDTAVSATETVKAKTEDPFSTPGRGGDSPFDRFEASTDWAEILEPKGWTLHHEDGDTRYWTRPDKNVSEGQSASTGLHEDRDRMWCFSDLAGLPVNVSMTKPYVYAALYHGGDLHKAAAALKGTAPKVVTANLPEEFWKRPVLDHIRQAAHARCRSADLVLGAVLARVASQVSPDLRFDTGLGAASMNLFIAAIGPSGGGKSTANRVAGELVPPPSYLDAMNYRDGISLGSGEGLAEAYMGTVQKETADTYKSGERKGQAKTIPVRQKVRSNVFVYVDEGAALTAQIERAGSTIGPAIRSAWNGEYLGQANAREETTRTIPAGSYSLGMVIGYQLGTARALISDTDAGTPQRFLWLSATDPSVPDDTPEYPGPLPLRLSRGDEVFQPAFPLPRTGTVEFEKSIRDRLRQQTVRRTRGEESTGAALDSHRPLMHSKVSALLCLLDDRMTVTEEDWELAGMILDTSDAVRAGIIEHGQETDRRTYEAKTEMRLATEERLQYVRNNVEKKVERVAKRITARLQEKGPMTRGAINRDQRGEDRSLTGEAIDYCLDQGWITQDGKEYKAKEEKA